MIALGAGSLIEVTPLSESSTTFTGEESLATTATITETTTAAETTNALVSYWPANEGALGEWTQTTANEGDIFSRYGSKYGSYMSPVGTPFNMRALSPSTNIADHLQIRTLKPFPMATSRIAPAFGQIGLGIQYKTPIALNILEELGYVQIVAHQ